MMQAAEATEVTTAMDRRDSSRQRSRRPHGSSRSRDARHRIAPGLGPKRRSEPEPARRSKLAMGAVLLAVSPLLLLAALLLKGALQTPSELKDFSLDDEALLFSGSRVRMLGPELEAPLFAASAPKVAELGPRAAPRAEPVKPTPAPGAWETRASTYGASKSSQEGEPLPEAVSYRPTRGNTVPRKLLMTWPIEGQSITSPFGGRTDPVDNVGTQHHKGVDIRAVTGTPVVAAAPGRVIFAARTAGSGLVIKIAHGPNLTTNYRHLASMRVRVGDRVQMGQRIGLSGATGRVTGPHLHFEIWENGRPQNPFDYAWAEFSEQDTATRLTAAARDTSDQEPYPLSAVSN